jgi:hypothetical protein
MIGWFNMLQRERESEAEPFAVLRLLAKNEFVGCLSGRSDGFSPLLVGAWHRHPVFKTLPRFITES